MPALEDDRVPRQARHAGPTRCERLEALAERARRRTLPGADRDARASARRARQGRPRHRHGRRVPRAAGHHGPLLRAARGRGRRGRRRDRATTTRRTGPNDALPDARPSASSWRWPTSSTRWSASSRSARSRPARRIPFALRRAALGIIRLILENGLRLPLQPSVRAALAGYGQDRFGVGTARVERRRPARLPRRPAEGAAARAGRAARPDRRGVRARRARTISSACWRASRRCRRSSAPRTARNLLTAYRRAANILAHRGEEGRALLRRAAPDRELLRQAEETALLRRSGRERSAATAGARSARISAARWRALRTLRAPVDAFFDKVTVNVDGAAICA